MAKQIYVDVTWERTKSFVVEVPDDWTDVTIEDAMQRAAQEEFRDYDDRCTSYPIDIDYDDGPMAIVSCDLDMETLSDVNYCPEDMR